MKENILSGMRTTGKLHIGNYFGMMKRMIDYQEENELLAFIVDMHALTSVNDAEQLRKATFDVALDWLALGLDPEKATLWAQSHVPEVAELTWYLSPITPMGLLQRCHSYKDKVAKGFMPNAALFSYPILMAADILLYDTDLVPVGEDQKQHVELARNIAQKFNLSQSAITKARSKMVKIGIIIKNSIKKEYFKVSSKSSIYK